MECTCFFPGLFQVFSLDVYKNRWVVTGGVSGGIGGPAAGLEIVDVLLRLLLVLGLRCDPSPGERALQAVKLAVGLVQLLAELTVPGSKAQELARVLHNDHQLVEPEGLRQVIIGARLYGLYRRFERGVPGYDYNQDVFVVLLELLDELESVEAGHLDIADDDVEVAGLELLEGLPAVHGYFRLIAPVPHGLGKQFPKVLVIVGYQYLEDPLSSQDRSPPVNFLLINISEYQKFEYF